MIRRNFLKTFVAVATVSAFILTGVPVRRSLAVEGDGALVKFRWRVPVAHHKTVEESLE